MELPGASQLKLRLTLACFDSTERMSQDSACVACPCYQLACSATTFGRPLLCTKTLNTACLHCDNAWHIFDMDNAVVMLLTLSLNVTACQYCLSGQCFSCEEFVSAHMVRVEKDLD